MVMSLDTFEKTVGLDEEALVESFGGLGTARDQRRPLVTPFLM
jgi:hypothetical protein